MINIYNLNKLGIRRCSSASLFKKSGVLISFSCSICTSKLHLQLYDLDTYMVHYLAL